MRNRSMLKKLMRKIDYILSASDKIRSVNDRNVADRKDFNEGSDH